MNSPGHQQDPAAQLYAGGQTGHAYHDIKRALRPDALEMVTTFRARKFQSHVSRSDVVFEFGVGAGWNLAKLQCARKLGCDAAGFLAPGLTALGIEFVPEISRVPAASVDVVMCHHTLEHLLHPAAALADFKRILRPAGKLLLHVPWQRERRYARYTPDDKDHHLYTWSAQDLGNLVVTCGYAIEHVAVRRYGYDRFSANFAAKLHLGSSGFRLLRSILVALKPLREIECFAVPSR